MQILSKVFQNDLQFFYRMKLSAISLGSIIAWENMRKRFLLISLVSGKSIHNNNIHPVQMTFHRSLKGWITSVSHVYDYELFRNRNLNINEKIAQKRNIRVDYRHRVRSPDGH